jgi:hypothetical protein
MTWVGIGMIDAHGTEEERKHFSYNITTLKLYSKRPTSHII